MFINTYEALNLLQETCAPTGAGLLVQTPSMFSSMQLFVFEDAWLDDTFSPFWQKYLYEYRAEKNQPLENNAVRGLCDEVSEHCRAHFAVAMRKLVGDKDCSAGAMPTRIIIPGGMSINDVPGPGGHQLLTVLTHKGGNVLLNAYEAQNCQRTPLHATIDRGIICRDVWV